MIRAMFWSIAIGIAAAAAEVATTIAATMIATIATIFFFYNSNETSIFFSRKLMYGNSNDPINRD